MDKISYQYKHKILEFFPNEDIMIVSYPRSGNTWVRYMLASLITNSEQAIDFPTMTELVPDLHKPLLEWDNLPERPPTGRLIKSHLPYDDSSGPNRVIYIVRDGRDVKISQYYYHCPHDIQATFLEFLQLDVWPGSWHEHVESWLDHANNISFLLVRYEDLLTEPEEQLKRMTEFAGLPADKQRISKAVRHSNFKSLQKMEQKKGGLSNERPDSKFFRKGVCGEWRKYFDPEHKAVFKARANPVLLRLGYIDGSDW